MEELRIGLVGTGAIGRTHIERINNTLQGAKVVGCADANVDFCKSVAEKYGITVRRVEFELEKAVKQLRVALKDYLPVLLMLLSDNILRS